MIKLIIKKFDDAIKDIEKNSGKIKSLENEIYEIKSKIFDFNRQILQQDEYKSELNDLARRIRMKRDLKAMQRQFHRLEVHGTVHVSCMLNSTERELTMENFIAILMVMRDSEVIIQDAL